VIARLKEVRLATRAHERFQMSQQIRRKCGYEHTYPCRQDDARVVLAFLEAHRELPPRGFFRRALFSSFSSAFASRGEGTS
jgi:hypothetical protein